MKLSIIIPVYNEEARIEKTMRVYHHFFSLQQEFYETEFVIVMNGCTDKTEIIVKEIRKSLSGNNIYVIVLESAGKGGAVKVGFLDALSRNNDLIGFVDADMATKPEDYLSLIMHMSGDGCDGVIASRYMPGSRIYPERPLWKRWGSRLVYEPLVRVLFRLPYYDLQCGAKLFTATVVQTIAPLLTISQWAFDVELLYLCKKFGFSVHEMPVTWSDQNKSKLTLQGGIGMLWALLKLHWYYFFTSNNCKNS
jgi:dolichyl-phosphate beta-glucosyltransferase